MTDYQALYLDVGRRIRRAREERGLTQDALASLVHLTRTSVTNIEKGRQKFLLHTLVDFAAVLRVSPASLLPDTVTTPAAGLEEALKDLGDPEKEWIKTAVDAVNRRG